MKRRTRFRGDLQVDGAVVGKDGQPFGGVMYLPHYAAQNWVSDLQGLDDGALDNASLQATFTPLATDKWVEIRVEAVLEASQASLVSIIIDPAGINIQAAVARKDAALAAQLKQELRCLVPPHTDYEIHLYDQAYITQINETPAL